MEPFTITELSYAVIAMSGALGGLLLAVWKSRCSTIQIGWGCIQCEREVVDDVLPTSKGSVPQPNLLRNEIDDVVL